MEWPATRVKVVLMLLTLISLNAAIEHADLHSGLPTTLTGETDQDQPSQSAKGDQDSQLEVYGGADCKGEVVQKVAATCTWKHLHQIVGQNSGRTITFSSRICGTKVQLRHQLRNDKGQCLAGDDDCASIFLTQDVKKGECFQLNDVVLPHMSDVCSQFGMHCPSLTDLPRKATTTMLRKMLLPMGTQTMDWVPVANSLDVDQFHQSPNSNEPVQPLH